MEVGKTHVLLFLVIIVIGVVLGNWAYKKLNLG
jgi:hypothetical protein